MIAVAALAASAAARVSEFVSCAACCVPNATCCVLVFAVFMSP